MPGNWRCWVLVGGTSRPAGETVCVCFVIYNIHVIICTVLLRHLVSQNHVDKLHLLIEQPEQAAHQT